MWHLPQAVVGRVGYRGMAHDPCGRVPSAARPVNPEEADAPDEIRLGVPQRHSRVVPKATLKARARVVYHLHPLQADRVVGVCLVRLALEPAAPAQRAARSLDVEGSLVGDTSQIGHALDVNVVAHEPD